MLSESERKELERLKRDPLVKLGRQVEREKQELYRLRMLRKKGLAAKESK